MPLKKIVEFEIELLDVLNSNGKVDEKLMPKILKKDLLSIYELMLFSRVFDEKALSLQKQGRIGTYAAQIGQEASIIGSAYALRKKDWLVPSFRESSAMITKGARPEDLFLYWAGNEAGSKMKANLRILPVSIPVASQILYATGVAFAMKKKKENSVVLVYLGDGASSKGDFHEAINFAGVFNLPIIFFCQNNQYAISTVVKKQTASKTIAQKAISYGIRGIRVDGNDLFAVYLAVKQAIKSAKDGLPTLIESFTYRVCDHTTSDYSFKYRTKKEVNQWKKRDPIDRFEKYLKSKKIINDKIKKQIQEKNSKKISKAVENFEKVKINPKDIFKFNYESMDNDLEQQFDEFKQVINDE